MSRQKLEKGLKFSKQGFLDRNLDNFIKINYNSLLIVPCKQKTMNIGEYHENNI